MTDVRENVIEWLNGEDTITATLNQVRYINKVKKLAIKYPDLVQILVENKDGSIVAHLPLKALKFNIIINNRMPGWMKESEDDDE